MESSRLDYCALVGKQGKVFQRPEIGLRLKLDFDILDFIEYHFRPAPHDSYFTVQKDEKRGRGADRLGLVQSSPSGVDPKTSRVEADTRSVFDSS
jgi:hypothetical protein